MSFIDSRSRMAYIDTRKPWCTQRLCQLSLTKLKYVLLGLEEYNFPTPEEIENCAYEQAHNADGYMSLVAKAIYDIMHVKRNIHTMDKDALIKFFDELRYGKEDDTEDVLCFDRRTYSENDNDVYFDRTKYSNKPIHQKVTETEELNDHRVSFQSAQDRIEDDIGSTASSSSHESELNQLDEAINQIKNTNFNAEALISKLKKRYSDDAKLSHKVKMKIHCLLELLEDFDCYDELLKNTA